jgi:hypothetical protein
VDFLTLIFIFIGGGWLIGKLAGNALFSKKEDFYYHQEKQKETPTIINNYKTENHLHISKEDLRNLSNK